jgi:hypothetical protein
VDHGGLAGARGADEEDRPVTVDVLEDGLHLRVAKGDLGELARLRERDQVPPVLGECLLVGVVGHLSGG